MFGISAKTFGLDKAIAKLSYKKYRQLRERGDQAGAHAAICEALRRWDDAPALWFSQRAQLAEKLGHRQQAFDDYRTAIARTDQPKARWHARVAHFEKDAGNIDAAIDGYRAAIALDPNRPAWQAELNWLSENRGEDGELPAERGAEWYDDVYLNSEEYKKDYEDSIYYPAWREIIERIGQMAPASLLEIGCGSGQLARAIAKTYPEIRYVGFDYSAAAIQIAKDADPSLNVRVWNAYDAEIYSELDFECYLSTEVLEHIDQDIGVLQNIPAGKRFIGTVPDYDSTSHIRFFSSEDEVAQRYGQVLDDISVDAIPIGAGRLFLFTGVRTSG